MVFDRFLNGLSVAPGSKFRTRYWSVTILSSCLVLILLLQLFLGWRDFSSYNERLIPLTIERFIAQVELSKTPPDKIDWNKQLTQYSNVVIFDELLLEGTPGSFQSIWKASDTKHFADQLEERNVTATSPYWGASKFIVKIRSSSFFKYAWDKSPVLIVVLLLWVLMTKILWRTRPDHVEKMLNALIDGMQNLTRGKTDIYISPALIETDPTLEKISETLSLLCDTVNERKELLKKRGELLKALELQVAKAEKQRRFLSTILESLPFGVVVLNRDLRVLVYNQRVPYADELPKELIDNADMAAMVRYLGEHGEFGKKPEEAKARMKFQLEKICNFESFSVERKRKNGRIFDIQGHAMSEEHFIITYTDITESKMVEQSLRQSESRYALAVRGANDALWYWDLTKNLVDIASSWFDRNSLPFPRMASYAQSFMSLFLPEDRRAVRRAVILHLRKLLPNLNIEVRMVRENGSIFWVLLRGIAEFDDKGRAMRMAGSLTDISPMKEAQEKLRMEALHDPLTGLPNRALFRMRLEQAMRRWEKSKTKRASALLYVDLDRFKLVNDSYGHEYGDQLLINVARRLSLVLGTRHTVARLGGDEFVVIVEDAYSLDEIKQLADLLVDSLRRPFVIKGHELYVSVSVGIAPFQNDGEALRKIVREADMAMYRAKQAGKDCVMVFDPTFYLQDNADLQLENDLREAILKQQFEVYYQPQYRIDDGQLHGFEALVRWHHPQHGLIGPAKFITIAEQKGLIKPMSLQVLRQVLSVMREWRAGIVREAPLYFSVNLSPVQLNDFEHIDELLQMVSHVHLAQDCLEFEITESTLLENPEYAQQLFSRLKENGISLAIDDFGTGYSSLSYLNRFQFDTLKIDQSFVAQMANQPHHRQIVEAIIQLSKTLNMRVVAEGVESASSLAYLRDMGCHFAQGYYFSKPLAAADALDLLIKQEARH